MVYNSRMEISFLSYHIYMKQPLCFTHLHFPNHIGELKIFCMILNRLEVTGLRNDELDRVCFSSFIVCRFHVIKYNFLV